MPLEPVLVYSHSLSPCPLSHEGRGGIPHQKAVRLSSEFVGSDVIDVDQGIPHQKAVRLPSPRVGERAAI